MQKLITALVKARAEFTSIQKDKTNPHYKNRYATLDAVLDAVTPALCKHGLAIVQSTSTESAKIELKTYLYHESGEHISSSYPLPDIMDAQKLGAALTCARRYALCALLSVTADEDDDGISGKAAETKSQVIEPRRSVAQPKPQAQKIEPQKQTAIDDLVAKTNIELKRLAWTNQQGRDYLVQAYGKRSRQQLTDIELQDFLNRLQVMPLEERSDLEPEHRAMRAVEAEIFDEETRDATLDPSDFH